jgi:lipoyl(octanoyl) transferase
MPASADVAGSGAIEISALGRTDYDATWRAMRSFTASRGAQTADALWLTEHDPVYTLGLAGRREHLRRDNGIPVVKSDRGGQITYHGPGQLVVYVMLDLRRSRLYVRELVRTLEAGVIDWLDGLRIRAWGREDAPGVYAKLAGGEAKIAALGLRVRNGCTYHGLAVNVAMDLSPFADIDPCGYPGLAVTQLADFGVERTPDAAGRELAPIVAAHLSEASRRRASIDAAEAAMS